MIILRQKEFGKLAGSKEQVQKVVNQFFTPTGKKLKKQAQQELRRKAREAASKERLAARREAVQEQQTKFFEGGQGAKNKQAKRAYEENAGKTIVTPKEIENGYDPIATGRSILNSDLESMARQKAAAETHNFLDFAKQEKLTADHKELHGYLRGYHRNYESKPGIFERMGLKSKNAKRKEMHYLDKTITLRGRGPLVGHRRDRPIKNKQLTN